MISKKYVSKQIQKMNETELLFASKNLLIKIHVITGWVLPGAEVLNILIDVFSKKLLSDYSALNVDEIEHAFIKSGTTVEDWGKEMNLNLFDKVLVPYVDQRFELSQLEEKEKLIPVQKILTDQEINNQIRGEIEVYFQAIKKGYEPIRHTYFEEILKTDGFLKEMPVDEFFTYAKGTFERLYYYEPVK